jgi:hypothetical protein
MNVTAIFELPVPIWISTGVLGERITSGFGSVTFDVLMPTDDGPAGGPPRVEGVEVPTVVDGSLELLTWAQRFAAFPSDRDSTAVCRVVVQTNGAANRWSDPYALARAIDPWFNAVRTWAETITGQDLDPDHRVYSATAHGARLTILEPIPTTEGPIALTLETPNVIPVPADRWRHILAQVAAGTEPPLEEQLSRDSRAAFARNQLRRSVIDAASAAEIVLHQVVSTQVTTADMPNREYRKKFEALDNQPLGGLVTIVEKVGVDLGVDPASLKELSKVRDDAIHRGVTPTHQNAYDVVQASIKLLGRQGPWKRAESLPDFVSEWVEVDPGAAE